MLLDEGLGVWAPPAIRALPARAGFTPVALDLDADASVAAAFQKADGDAGGFDSSSTTPAMACTEPSWNATLPTGSGSLTPCWAARCGCRTSCAGMLARNRGAVVNVSSLAVDFPLPFMSGYNVVKAGLAAFSESMMIEVAGTSVIVIDFRPGDYRTRFNQTMQARSGIHPPTEAPAADRRRRAWTMLEENIDRRLRDTRGGRSASGAPASPQLHRQVGTFFQAWLAPLLARLVPLGLRRAATARYFGCFLTCPGFAYWC